MCLEVNSVVKTAPDRRKAWKVVDGRRRPIHQSLPGNGSYNVGEIYEVDRAYIDSMAYRYEGIPILYYFGFHVFTSLLQAEANLNSFEQIIEVEVDPADWVADGLRNDAVYSKLKVIT